MTTQLCENDRRFLTRRTGIVRQLSNPNYSQTVKYLTSDVARRILVGKYSNSINLKYCKLRDISQILKYSLLNFMKISADN